MNKASSGSVTPSWDPALLGPQAPHPLGISPWCGKLIVQQNGKNRTLATRALGDHS